MDNLLVMAAKRLFFLLEYFAALSTVAFSISKEMNEDKTHLIHLAGIEHRSSRGWM